MINIFTFSETTPSAPGTVASSRSVGSSLGPAGVAADLSQYSGLIVEANLVGATGGTLDVYVQFSTDEGTTWYDYAHFTQLAGGATAVSYVFSAATGAQNLTLATVGKNLNPALASGTVVGGSWGDRMRLVFVAGGGTTAGAAITVNIVGQRTDVYPR